MGRLLIRGHRTVASAAHCAFDLLGVRACTAEELPPRLLAVLTKLGEKTEPSAEAKLRYEHRKLTRRFPPFPQFCLKISTFAGIIVQSELTNQCEAYLRFVWGGKIHRGWRLTLCGSF